jgi:hypothetical protein
MFDHRMNGRRGRSLQALCAPREAERCRATNPVAESIQLVADGKIEASMVRSSTMRTLTARHRAMRRSDFRVALTGAMRVLKAGVIPG